MFIVVPNGRQNYVATFLIKELTKQSDHPMELFYFIDTVIKYYDYHFTQNRKEISHLTNAESFTMMIHIYFYHGQPI